jgi:hypothetical protein
MAGQQDLPVGAGWLALVNALSPSSPAPATAPEPQPTAAPHETSIKLGCASGPLASGIEETPDGLSPERTDEPPLARCLDLTMAPISGGSVLDIVAMWPHHTFGSLDCLNKTERYASRINGLPASQVASTASPSGLRLIRRPVTWEGVSLSCPSVFARATPVKKRIRLLA